MAWKQDVYQRWLNREGGNNEVADHRQCRLGRWYYEGEGAANYKGLPSYSQLEIPHASVHKNGMESLDLLKAGDLEGSVGALANMERASDETISLLTRLGNEIGN
ncbi:CZB domain-containing protein [Pseudomaricurvus alkylphenolicus]|uniref:CZB domain-containing protein n=1 Tax=Pseudomaricurvus alkylphenolicus TaxID=1306991 RepID=UPI003B833632